VKDRQTDRQTNDNHWLLSLQFSSRPNKSYSNTNTLKRHLFIGAKTPSCCRFISGCFKTDIATVSPEWSSVFRRKSIITRCFRRQRAAWTFLRCAPVCSWFTFCCRMSRIYSFVARHRWQHTIRFINVGRIGTTVTGKWWLTNLNNLLHTMPHKTWLKTKITKAFRVWVRKKFSTSSYELLSNIMARILQKQEFILVLCWKPSAALKKKLSIRKSILVIKWIIMFTEVFHSSTKSKWMQTSR